MDIYRKLANILIEKGVITQSDLEKAVAHQQAEGGNLGECLVACGALSENELLGFLSKQLEIPLYDLKDYQPDEKLTNRLKEAFARRFKALVLAEDKDGFLVGMADPLDVNAVDVLRYELQKNLRFALVREKDLLRTLDSVYRRAEDIHTYAEELHEEVIQADLDVSGDESEVASPVTKLLKSIFDDAVQIGASDIHIEPAQTVLRMRLRVDGVLQEQTIDAVNIANAMIVRLKLMANLDISEKRVPQDGRFHIKSGKKEFDVRLSTMPQRYGEAAVMRLLDKTSGVRTLKQAGMNESVEVQFKHLLTVPHGIILVTGPTGSGKSTTLYSVLNLLNEPGKKIISVEDPIEYELDRVNQIQVNPKVGLTFAKVLRSTLRQDPDIIMIGEMRDRETAEIAVRAALTGHVVFSTLHTNDAASSAFRLVDMDIPGYLVAATLRGVLAQRLLRRVCKRCAKARTPTNEEKIWLEEYLQLAQFKVAEGKGCSHCSQTGYSGRVGVFELLELDARMMEALRQNDPSAFYDYVAQNLKGKLLIDQALQIAAQGQTSVAEVLRVMGGY